jgi:acylphosphatase
MDKGPDANDNERMIVCKYVRYTGRVQGVGFRYTAQHLAEKFLVSGYVRNLPNGDVELAAEGEAERVEAFLNAVAGRFNQNIRQSVVREAACSGYQGFQVRY